LNWVASPPKRCWRTQFREADSHEAAERGLTVGDVKVDYSKMVARSRAIADKLAKGIAHLFRKYEVKSEQGVGQLLKSHAVKISSKSGEKEVTQSTWSSRSARGRCNCGR